MLSAAQRSRLLLRRAPRVTTCCSPHFSTATTNITRGNESTDRLLVVGSGVAGSAAALVAAQVYNIPVTLLFAGESPSNCNSYWAQGGIIYRNFDPNSGDSAEALSRDIHTAGAGLCQHDAVTKVATEGPSIVEQLLLDASGTFANVPFDKCQATNELSLCLGMSEGHVSFCCWLLLVCMLTISSLGHDYLYRGIAFCSSYSSLQGCYWTSHYRRDNKSLHETSKHYIAREYCCDGLDC